MLGVLKGCDSVNSVVKAVQACMIAIALHGCMAVNNSAPGISKSENDVTVIVGVKHAHRVAIIAGAIANGKFTPYQEGYAANIRPTDGYVVTQLPSRQGRYAITRVLIQAGSESFGDCEWKQALTFSADGGKVVYLGDLDFRVSRSQLTIEQSNDIEGVRQYVNSNYPMLKGLVEYDEPILMPHAKANCEDRKNSQYQIIFLPRRR